jgi:ferredoxin
LNVYQLKKLGAEVANFDEEEWIKVESPLKLALKVFCIAKTVLDCDLIISVAKMKTHAETKVTLSIKNALGMISKNDRRAAHMINIDRAIIDVFAYLTKNKKLISFVDAIYALEGRRGPTIGNPVKMDLVIAGDNPIAVDATCVEIMGYDTKKVRHLMLCKEHGLGEMNGKMIGERIEDVRRKFEMPLAIPSFKSYLLSHATNEFFKKTPYLRYREKCIGCKTCVENCPICNIVFENGVIKIDRKKCIGCIICVESCRRGALDYEISHYHIYVLLKKVKELIKNTTSLINVRHAKEEKKK